MSNVKEVIKKLKAESDINKIMAFLTEFMGHAKLRECINSMSGEEIIEMPKSKSKTKSKIVAPPKKERGAVRILPKESPMAEKLKKSFGVEETVVKGDGNCQFRSIAVLLGKDSKEWKSVKKQMLECLEQRPEEMLPPEVLEVSEIVNEAKEILSKDGEWGNETTLNIARNCFNMTIHVFDKRGGNPIKDNVKRALEGTVVWNGTHYNPTKQIKTKTKSKPVKSEKAAEIAAALSGYACAVLAHKLDNKTDKYVVAKFLKNKWSLRVVAGGDPWLTKTTALKEGSCKKIDPSEKMTKELAESLLSEAGIEQKYWYTEAIGSQWESSFGKYNSFGFGKTDVQKMAANNNFYVVGVRKNKNKNSYMAYKFDKNKKDWLRTKNKKPKASWVSLETLKKNNSFGSKPTKKCIEKFMSLKELYLDPKKFNFKKDTQLPPLKASHFGVIKQSKGLQLYPLGKGSFLSGPKKGVSATFSQKDVIDAGLWPKTTKRIPKKGNNNYFQFGKTIINPNYPSLYAGPVGMVGAPAYSKQTKKYLPKRKPF